MALPFKSPSAAQALPLTHLHRLLELVMQKHALHPISFDGYVQSPRPCPLWLTVT